MKSLIRKFVPPFLISWYHFALSFLGAVIYGFPSKKIKVIGVTGTNGKSTVVNLIVKILEEAELRVASVSSISFKIKEIEEPNFLKMTMPGRFKLQQFLNKALKKGCQYVVVEVTSEGIMQHRHRFIDFDVVVFTNLTPEHIEAHGSFERYKEAKGKLFQSLGKSRKNERMAIVNLDDREAAYFLNFEADRKIGYGISVKSHEPLVKETVKAEEVRISSEGTDFMVEGVTFRFKLLGRFNVYNALAAISVALSQNIDLETCQRALKKAKEISGRMEKVIDQSFKVFVDYAHTPDALKAVYSALPESSRKICLLGSCGGGRDKWKRPRLGEIADQFCNQIILTNEDPYNENPMQIINQVEEGVKKKKAIKILDRREATRKALSLAKAGDIVIITGKGSEPWMCVKGGKKIPWDDRKIVKEEFEKL